MNILGIDGQPLIQLLSAFISLMSLLYVVGNMGEIAHVLLEGDSPYFAHQMGLSAENFEAGRVHKLLIASIQAIATMTAGIMLVLALRFETVVNVWNRIEWRLQYTHRPFTRAVIFRLFWVGMGVLFSILGMPIDGTGPTGKLIQLDLIVVGLNMTKMMIYGVVFYIISRRLKPLASFPIMMLFSLLLTVLLIEANFFLRTDWLPALPRRMIIPEFNRILERMDFPLERVLLNRNSDTIVYTRSLFREALLVGGHFLSAFNPHEIAAATMHELVHRQNLDALFWHAMMGVHHLGLQMLIFFLILPFPEVYSEFGFDVEGDCEVEALPTMVGLSIAELLFSRIQSLFGLVELWLQRWQVYIADRTTMQEGYGYHLSQYLLQERPIFLDSTWLFEWLYMNRPANLARVKMLGYQPLKQAKTQQSAQIKKEK